MWHGIWILRVITATAIRKSQIRAWKHVKHEFAKTYAKCASEWLIFFQSTLTQAIERQHCVVPSKTKLD